MRTSVVRRCAPAFRPIRWLGNVFGLTGPFARGARGGRAVTLATHQSEGLVRVRGRVCLRTLRLRTLRVASGQQSFPEGVKGRFEAADDPLAGGLYGIADPGRDGTRPNLPFRLPAWDCWTGSDPRGEGGTGVYVPTLPDARTGHRNWGVAPSHGLKARFGIDESGDRGLTTQPPAT